MFLVTYQSYVVSWKLFYKSVKEAFTVTAFKENLESDRV